MNIANKITISRMIFIPLIIFLLYPYPHWIEQKGYFFTYLNQYGIYYAAVLFVLTAATDKLDGYIARKYHLVTNLGKLLDPLADKLLISTTIIMLVLLQMIPSWVAIIIIGREIIITALRSVASAKGIALAADKHGKLKMVFQVIAITAIMLNNYPFSFVTNLPIHHILLAIAVILTIYSGINYLLINYQKLQLNT